VKAADRGEPQRRRAVVPLLLGAVVLPAVALADVAGRLSVSSDPAGATLYLDGDVVGKTPTAPRSVSVGVHRLRLVKPGFIEDERSVEVAASEFQHIQVDLRLAEADRSTKGRSGWKRSLLLAAGGAAVTAGALLPSPSPSQATLPESAPTGGSASVDPDATEHGDSLGFAGVTQFVFSTGGWTDRDGDSLMFTWDFGDGTQGVGQVVGHTYQGSGVYDVQLDVSDGHFSAHDALRLSVGDVAGRWAGGVPLLGDQGVILELIQEGAAIRGTLSAPLGSGSVVGHAAPPRKVHLTLQIEGEEPRQISVIGAVSAFCDRIDFGDTHSLEWRGE
jgi:hypothetical protein